MIVQNDKVASVILIQEFPESTRPMVISEEARQYGFRLVHIFPTENTWPRDLEICGAFVLEGTESALVRELITKKIPCLRVGAFSPREDNLPSISIQYSEGGKTAADYFISHHFKTLGYVGNENWRDSDDIFEAMRATSAKVGCDCHFFRLQEFGTDGGYAQDDFSEMAKTFGNWVTNSKTPIGLLAYNDRVASRIISFCQHLGFRVPQDVSVIGLGNNFFLCETAVVKISSIHSAWAKMWRSAFEMMDACLKGKGELPISTRVTPGNVAERESTDFIPIEDPLVHKAIQFIWAHYHEDIRIDDFVKQEMVSRSTLHRGFQKTLGRGFNEELRRRRLAVAQRLLENTDKTVKEIATMVGFNSGFYFHRTFKNAFGQTPQEYRNLHQW